MKITTAQVLAIVCCIGWSCLMAACSGSGAAEEATNQAEKSSAASSKTDPAAPMIPHDTVQVRDVGFRLPFSFKPFKKIRAVKVTHVVMEDGSVYCWGGNQSGQTFLEPVTTPIKMNLPLIRDMDRGDRYFPLFLTKEGSVIQLDDQCTENPSYDEVDISDVAMLASSSLLGSCALKKDGTVWCWDGAQPEMKAGLIDIALIEGGYSSFCAVTKEGAVFCWGSNASGQLGAGDLDDHEGVVAVAGLGGPAKDLSIGHAFACALKDDNTVWCWGDNEMGQIEASPTWNSCIDATTDATILEPRQIAGLADVVQISTGHQHTCALKKDGAVTCWGYEIGATGATGFGVPLSMCNELKQVSKLSGVRIIDAGSYHTCAIGLNGKVVCWGDNGLGQMANGKMEEGMDAKHPFPQGILLPY